MRLDTWLTSKGRSISWLSKTAGIGYATAHRASGGTQIKTIRVARAISDATDGDVTVSELERGFDQAEASA